MSSIIVKFGEYRNQAVVNTKFNLVKGYQTGKKGGYVTVKNEGQFPIAIDVVKIKVNNIHDIEFNGAPVIAEESQVVENVVSETEEDAMNRIAIRFGVLDEMSRACIAGDIRAMIVTGPAGIGKSHGVTTQMEKATLFDQVAGNKTRFEIVKGAMSGIGLFAKLYKFSDAKNVLVFDDCDSILLDDVALNLLKGALDSGKKRKISWLADSRILRQEGIPDSFEFKGSVIFITNLKFDKMKSQKLRDHLDALQSRCHYLDLTLDTQRDKILRIKQIAGDGVLFDGYDFNQQEQDEIIEFMNQNKDRLRELSLRMALKIADLRKSFPAKWKAMANTTCIKVMD
jgi:hypothetical protein